MNRHFQIQSAVIIGSGNVAGHLAVALQKAGLPIWQVWSKHRLHAESLAGKTGSEAVTDFSEIRKDAGLYLISVPDDKIKDVAGKLPDVSGVVCHTSGFTSLQVLQRFVRHGVFYPLQTFSKDKETDLSVVPFCLEASSPEILRGLWYWADKLSSSVYAVSSEKRKVLHLAAVLVNNFTNHLYALAEDFLKQNQIDRNLLLPLIKETVSKLETLSAREAQTGPARRNDRQTIENHLKMLENNADIKEIYQIFTRQILKEYHE